MIFDLLAPPQGVGTKTIVSLYVRFMWVTHTPNLVEFRKQFFGPPNTLCTPKIQPLEHDSADWIKILTDMFYGISFICEKTHKVWFKNIWNWLSNWNLMIFDLFAPPKGPGGGDQ